MMSIAQRILSLFLRLFFYLLYNPLAWIYDWVSAIVSLGHWQEWIACTLPYLSGKRVLELGHGPGHLQVAMQERGITVFGLDLSRTMGKQARRRLVCHAMPCRLVRAKSQQLPFSSQAFDQIVSTFPSEFLFQYQTLAEIYRVLVPGGLLVVLPVAWIRRGTYIERSFAWLFQITHQAPPQSDESWRMHLITLFQQAGFEVDTEMISQASSEVFLLLASRPKVL
jgi:ubiquinone/menaquinone biosynthesis C-methylase UbiE